MLAKYENFNEFAAINTITFMCNFNKFVPSVIIKTMSKTVTSIVQSMLKGLIHAPNHD